MSKMPEKPTKLCEKNLLFSLVCVAFLSIISSSCTTARELLAAHVKPAPLECGKSSQYVSLFVHLSLSVNAFPCLLTLKRTLSEPKPDPVPVGGPRRPAEEKTRHPQSQDDARLGTGGTSGTIVSICVFEKRQRKCNWSHLKVFASCSFWKLIFLFFTCFAKAH